MIKNKINVILVAVLVIVTSNKLYPLNRKIEKPSNIKNLKNEKVEFEFEFSDDEFAQEAKEILNQSEEEKENIIFLELIEYIEQINNLCTDISSKIKNNLLLTKIHKYQAYTNKLKENIQIIKNIYKFLEDKDISILEKKLEQIESKIKELNSLLIINN